MDATESAFVESAARHFAKNNLFIRAANTLGRPVEALVRHVLPEAVADKVSMVTEKALRTALEASLKTLPSTRIDQPFAAAVTSAQAGKWGHAALTSGTGAIGGFFGLAALPVELPLTTTLMLRQVASTAREFGEDLGTLDTRLECLSVFALSGAKDREDEGYYAARVGLSEFFRAASGWATRMTLEDVAAALSRGQAPLLMRFLLKIAERFELLVTEKAMLAAVPLLSTATAAVVNTVFTEHVGATAVYHFGLRALERRYGEREVKSLFEAAKARQVGV